MRFTISDLVELLWLKHAQMMMRGAAPRASQVPAAVDMPATKQPAQVVPHKPADDHRLRASQM